MSRQVDLSKELSETDRTYLMSRDRHEEVAFNAVRFGTDLPEEVQQDIASRGISMQEVRQRVEIASAGSDTSEGTPSPEDPSSARTDETGGRQDAPPLPDGPEKFSEEWFDSATKATLEEELRARNLKVSGTRDELADRLYEAVNPDEDDEDEDDDTK